jgi:hypothetical protein
MRALEAMSISVPESMRTMLTCVVTCLVVALLVAILTPVLIPMAIIAAEVAICIVSIAATIAPMFVVAASVPVIVEPVHSLDQRVGDGRADQQVDCCVAVMASAGAQRNRQAQRKPCGGKPLRAASGGSVSGSNVLHSVVHRLVLFHRMRWQHASWRLNRK